MNMTLMEITSYSNIYWLVILGAFGLMFLGAWIIYYASKKHFQLMESEKK